MLSVYPKIGQVGEGKSAEKQHGRVKRINARKERKTDPKEEGWLAMVNGWDPARRRSCGGEKGKTLRREWDREVKELWGAECPGVS
jgi:hypothetical protein